MRSELGVAGGLLAALVVLLGVFTLSSRPGVPQDTERAEGGEVYDPFWAGEEMPPGYRQLLARDVIRPIYEPWFVPASEARYDPETLVIGVALGDEARAYPVNELNRREMVNDWMHGTPILVTW